MKIKVIQPEIYWKDPTANRANIEEMLWQTDDKVDLIVLPESFNTGFTPENTGLAEPLNGATMQWMHQIAKQFNAAICGSIFTKDKGQVFNKLAFITPEDPPKFYNKRHLFSLSNEQQISAGTSALNTEFKGFQLGFSICYDLRFPVWCKKVGEKSEILIFVANWPAARIQQWRALLIARAIENQCYVIGANITGKNIGGTEYNGNSLIISYDGTVLVEANKNPEVIIEELHKENLLKYRDQFPFLKDSDKFILE